MLCVRSKSSISLSFFFNDTPTTEIYTLSLHDALPIYPRSGFDQLTEADRALIQHVTGQWIDRKSTRLNSSHGYMSDAVFCLKKKKPGRLFHADILVGAFADHRLLGLARL